MRKLKNLIKIKNVAKFIFKYFFKNLFQIVDACIQITNDKNLQNGFNAIGFSQGSQFLRALVQRCPEAKVKNLITLGGQHQGMFTKFLFYFFNLKK